MTDDTFRTKPALCPSCGDKLDAATAMPKDNPRAPEPGDVSVCLNCDAVLVFDDDMQLRKMTVQEWYQMPLVVQAQIMTVRTARSMAGIKQKKNPEAN